jgi:hypothetical protein
VSLLKHNVARDDDLASG